jgi:DNA helicase-2/ATP-dependent DNA helicase PcrA
MTSAPIMDVLQQGPTSHSYTAFTFTNPAAGELNDRDYQLCKEQLGSHRGLAESSVGTRHSFRLHSLRSPTLGDALSMSGHRVSGVSE